MQKTSIIIVSYNTLELTQLCLMSLREYTPAEMAEIIVVDNASSDGSREWLKEQPDIRLICNEENRGFPQGCNQGMEIAAGDSILLLNSDTIVTANWLQNLRNALFSSPEVGAVGCVTNNSSNWQKVPINYTTFGQMQEFAAGFNQSNPQKWEERLMLVGFCLLFKREVYEKIGGLDEIFTPGNYEDDDYCLRISQAGYKLILCKDTFIHHFGGGSFIRDDDEAKQKAKEKRSQELAARNREIFCRKWQLDSRTYKELSEAFLKIQPDIRPGAAVLEVDCGCGFDLLVLKNLRPDLRLQGITSGQGEARVAGRLLPAIHCQDLEKEIWQYLRGKYAVVILTDWFAGVQNKEAFLQKIATYLESGGRIYTREQVYEVK